MLAHTSHLPPASHHLSVLAKQSTLITSDMGEQERESGEPAEEGNVFWLMGNAKCPLFCFLPGCPPPTVSYLFDLLFNPFTLSLMQQYLSNRVGCIKEALPQQSVTQSSMNSCLASA